MLSGGFELPEAGLSLDFVELEGPDWQGDWGSLTDGFEIPQAGLSSGFVELEGQDLA